MVQATKHPSLCSATPFQAQQDHSASLVDKNVELAREADKLPSMRKQLEGYKQAKCESESKCTDLALALDGLRQEHSAALASVSTLRSELAHLRKAQVRALGAIDTGAPGYRPSFPDVPPACQPACVSVAGFNKDAVTGSKKFARLT